MPTGSEVTGRHLATMPSAASTIVLCHHTTKLCWSVLDCLSTLCCFCSILWLKGSRLSLQRICSMGSRKGRQMQLRLTIFIILSWLAASPRAFHVNHCQNRRAVESVAPVTTPRFCHRPSNPKWTWPLSLILTFSLSASNLRARGRFTRLKAFAKGLEGCDHHGAGRYEFDPLQLA